MFCEFLTHVVLDIVQECDLVTIRDQDITVYFMNKDFVHDIRLDLRCLLDHLIQGLTCTLEIRVVSINDIDECTT